MVSDTTKAPLADRLRAHAALARDWGKRRTHPRPTTHEEGACTMTMSMLPDSLAFLKKEPPPMQPKNADEYGRRAQMHPDTDRVVESIRATAEENLQLTRTVEGQRARISELEMKLRLVEDAVLRTEADRDYYIRKATSLEQGLTNVNSIVVALVNSANQKANAEYPAEVLKGSVEGVGDGLAEPEPRPRSGIIPVAKE